MPIIESIKEILIGSVIIVITFLSIGSVIEYLREEYDNKIKKKTVKGEEKTVDEYEDGHYKGDMD